MVLGWAWAGSGRAGQSRDLGFPPIWERKERNGLFLVEESLTRQSLSIPLSLFPPPFVTKQLLQPLRAVFWELFLLWLEDEVNHLFTSSASSSHHQTLCPNIYLSFLYLGGAGVTTGAAQTRGVGVTLGVHASKVLLPYFFQESNATYCTLCSSQNLGQLFWVLVALC